MIHTLCTIRFRNQRTDQGSLDPGSVHFSCMSFAVSCIRRVRSRRGSGWAGASGFTALIGMSSRLDGPLHRWAMPSRGPTCLRVVRRGLSSAARTLCALGLERGEPALRRTLSAQNAGRRAGGTWFYGLSANPLRGDSAGVRWPPYRRSPLGRSRREATPICRLRSPWKMAVPGPGMIVSASVADDFPCRPGGRVTGSRCREFRPKGTPI